MARGGGGYRGREHDGVGGIQSDRARGLGVGATIVNSKLTRKGALRTNTLQTSEGGEDHLKALSVDMYSEHAYKNSIDEAFSLDRPRLYLGKITMNVTVPSPLLTSTIPSL